APALRKPRDLPVFTAREDGEDDHAYIARWRRQGPVVRDRFGFLCTFSHAHMLQLTDPKLTRQVETEGFALRGITSGPAWTFAATSVLLSNGERHGARRRPLARTFAWKLMDALRPRVRAAAEALIRPQLGAGPIDFIDEVSGPLPALMIADILGAPEADIPRFTKLVYSAMRILSNRSDEVMAAAAEDLGRLDAYVKDLLDARRAAPQDDFLSRYVADVAEADLDAQEIRTQIVTLILAGSDTTRMSLASTVSQLLQHPEQWRAFAADPEGLKAAVAAEGLRFDPVIGSLPRVATADFVLDDVEVKAGAVLAPMVVAALRDPEVYAAPDRFDIHRADHPRYHPVFGAGAHRCLGEALARAELEESLAALVELAPSARLEGPPPVLRGLSGARGITRMPISLAA
ncbi:MAG: cytochrome P450, partial [Pseudomonadota bacterium]